MAVEIHPFETFSPKDMQYLLIGSFTSKDAYSNSEYNWYYSNGRNQFWSLIEQVYNVRLPDKQSKLTLFSNLGIGITDIIYKVNRTRDSSLDNVLKVIEYNPNIDSLLAKNLKAVFFSSRFVEDHFTKNFSNLIDKYSNTEFLYLPSPSPRYAAMSKLEKIEKYKKLLPKFSKKN
jgi:hypoxanthine-DNA glycosylase